MMRPKVSIAALVLTAAAATAACSGSTPPPQNDDTLPTPAPSGEGGGGAARPPKRPGAPASGATKELEQAIKAANAKDFDTAIRLANAAIEKDPSSEKAYLLLGSTCAMKGDDACEKAAYDRGTAAIPTSAALLDERGHLALEAGDKDAAVKDLERAHQLSGGKDAKIMGDLAYAYMFVDRLDEGAALAHKARMLDPKSFDAASAHGELLLRKKDGKNAAEAFRAASALTDDPEVKSNLEGRLGVALELDGQFADALAIFEKKLAANAGDAVMHVRATEALLNLNRAKDAVPHMQAAVKLAPDNARYWSILLETQEKAGDKKGAEATKKKLASMKGKP